MQIQKISNDIDAKRYLKELGVDSGGIKILAQKMKQHFIYIKDLHVGGANILKQDALSVGADLAVPRGTVVASQKYVNCILIATARELEYLSKKELAQPFGLSSLALELKKFIKIKKPRRAEVMGIINANDDSFYTSSRFKDKKALKTIYKMIEDGADIIDIGGVSSRPNAPMVSIEEELRRLKPILDAVKKKQIYKEVKFSIDSYEPEVVSYALESGFEIVNDITGLANDEVCKLCADYKATAIIMHMQGVPQTMQENPDYDDIVNDVYSFLNSRVQKAESFGVKNIVIDLGIGFGKTLEHNLKLLKHLEGFLTLKKPILIGASRKSLIDKISSSTVENRLAGTIALHLEAFKNGASIFRVHDVAEHIQALRVQEALNG